jgi:Icc-related predicted phosphoesterase
MSEKNLNIFFTTDIHGSERCFMKFVNAGKFYGVDVLIMGGDITGKVIVPIIHKTNGNYTCFYMGSDRELKTESEIQELEKNIRQNGYYPYRTTPEEVSELESDEAKRDALFREIQLSSFRRWLDIAAERLEGTGIRCFITPGNDDLLELDEVFDPSDYVVNPEGKAVRLDEHHEMISLGWSNPTPWNSPREAGEEELERQIEDMADQIEEMDNAIFNFHCPPWDSGIDSAPLLDENLKVQTIAGNVDMIPVGSTAVRQAIDTHQPLLGVHGHIHESRGIVRLGRTLCLNPGSDYTEGILRGALVTLSPDQVEHFELVSG